MKKLNILLIALLLIALSILGGFAIHKWQIKQQLQAYIKAEKKESNSTYPIKTVKSLKEGESTYYYFSPLKDSDDFYKNNLPLSLYKYKEKSHKYDLIFIKPVIKTTALKGIKEVIIHKINYEQKFFKLIKSSDKIISHYYSKDDFSPFKIEELFSNHPEKLAEAIKKLKPDYFFDLAKMDQLSEDDNLLKNAYHIHKDTISFEEKVEVPISSLFDSINPIFLEGDLKHAYEAYLEKKKEEQAKLASEKRVALTFDDGPNPATTPQVLSLLEKYHAKATFFMMGSKIPGNESLVKKVADAGHEIANHSYDHPDLTKLNDQQIKYQINTTNEAISKVIGKRPIYLRPPYGATNDRVRQLAGLTEILWTVDTRDWENRNTNAIMTNIKQQLHPGGIILMHDIHQTSVNALPSVLDYLQKEGYTCVTVSVLMGKE